MSPEQLQQLLERVSTAMAACEAAVESAESALDASKIALARANEIIGDTLEGKKVAEALPQNGVTCRCGLPVAPSGQEGSSVFYKCHVCGHSFWWPPRFNPVTPAPPPESANLHDPWKVHRTLKYCIHCLISCDPVADKVWQCPACHFQWTE